MKHKRTLKLTLIAILLMAVFALLAACGENGMGLSNKSRNESSNNPFSSSKTDTGSEPSKTFTVYFYDDGKEIARQTVKKGDVLKFPANLEKAGYLFDAFEFTYQGESYLLDPDFFEEEIRFNGDADITLYAKWDPLFDISENTIVQVHDWQLSNIEIPDKIDGIEIKYIGYRAFCSVRESLKSITIPNSVTEIEEEAFESCRNLTSVTIPNSVKYIGNDAFLGCNGLENVTVESGNLNYHSAGNCLIETASKTLILGCNNSVIPIDGSVMSIGDLAFQDCSGLTSITIPNSVTSIGKRAFEGCIGLKSVTMETM